MTDWKKEADGIEMGTLRRLSPNTMLVSREKLHALVLRAVEETKKETIKKVVDLANALSK